MRREPRAMAALRGAGRGWRPLLLGLLMGGTASVQSQEHAASAKTPETEPGLEELLRQPLKQVPRDIEVSTAARFTQSASQAPTTTYVVTALDIARFGYRNMSDILRAMPGLYITKDNGFSYVGARGLGRPGDLNTRLLFLIDGMRINENVYDAALISEEFFVDADLIERVEFAPGPGSALYGNNAFLGVVNVITKRVDKMAGVEARASIDSVGVQHLRASWGHRSEAGWEGWLALSGTKQDRRPYAFDTGETPDPLESELRDQLWNRAKRLLLSFNAGGWAFRGGATSLTQGLPVQVSEQNPDLLDQGYLISDNSFVSLSHERSLGPDWDLFASVSFKKSRYQERYPLIFEQTQQRRYYGTTARGRWSNWDLRLSTRRWLDHTVMAGVELQDDDLMRISQALEGESPFQEFFGINRRVGVFIQDEWQLSATQRLVLGLRRDTSHVAEPKLNPRLAWVWNGVPDATLRLMYGGAFRAANLNEFALNSALGVPTPVPEQIKTYEASWEQALTPQLQYRAALYASRLSNLMELNQVDLPVYENSGQLRNIGSELDLERRWDQGASLRIGLSLQRTRDQHGAGLSNSPRALFKLFYSQPLAGDALQLSWQSFAMSRRHTAFQELPGYWLNNLNLLWRPRLDVDLSLGVYNLGGTRYLDRPASAAPAIKQEGRTLQLSVSWRLPS